MNKLDLTDGKETAINRAFSFFLYSPLTVGLAQNRRTIIKKEKEKNTKGLTADAEIRLIHGRPFNQRRATWQAAVFWRLTRRVDCLDTSLLLLRLPACARACLYFIFRSQAARCNISQRIQFWYFNFSSSFLLGVGGCTISSAPAALSGMGRLRAKTAHAPHAQL